MTPRPSQPSDQNVLALLKLKTPPANGDLSHVIKENYPKRDEILKLAKKYPTPFYLMDVPQLNKNILEFQGAFTKHFPESRIYYAVKSNHHPFILQTVVDKGWGLDVSSGHELSAALATGCKKIVFSGPGKTEAELLLALKNADRVTVHMDSVTEFKRLDRLAKKMKTKVLAGIRIFTSVHGAWSKFGIPLKELKGFWLMAQKSKFVELRGIQFHLSWNREPTNYVKVIEELGAYLKKNFTAEMRANVRFLDMGGGYFPDAIEAYYPWTIHYPGVLPLQHIRKAADTYYGQTSTFEVPYYVIRSASLEVFAEAIGKAVAEHLKPVLKNTIFYTEPGRIICAKAMHIVVRVIDKKTPKNLIADGGVNISGWEYGEHFYYPLLNLTHPSLKKEMECTLYGPLCTPHDIWGYRCYATKMEEGDVILVPNQGAYRYVLAQSFIKEIPEVRFLK